MTTRLTAKEIAARNDSLRRSLPFVALPDRAVMTRGIAALPADEIAAIMEKVRTFDDFNSDNDPHLEHDCASFCLCGRRLMFKIDNYDGHEGLRLVLTILLAEEY